VTANYWDYPTGSNRIPDGINSNGDPNYQVVYPTFFDQGQPNAVTNAGSASSAYGTYGQGGNVSEWIESAFDGVNDSGSEIRLDRGGHYRGIEGNLRASTRIINGPGSSIGLLGFRVASIPEPGSAALLAAAFPLLLRRRR
jgi:formylglycine-generating enzyme required for sulfatase activity